ncbi:NHLP bacteriocin export ABC transporter permease/ATPase subunit [Oscillospiraceae bacterium PP1C4]
MELNKIALSGGQKFLTDEKGCTYRVQSGSILVYVLPILDGRPSRRVFLYQAEQGELLPSVDWEDEEGTKWRFAFIAVEKAEIVREAKDVQLLRDFANRAGIAIHHPDDIEEDFVEYYRLYIVKEEGYIYTTAKERKNVYERSLQLIADVFAHGKAIRPAYSGNRLYDAVSLLCAAKRIEAVSFETLREAMGLRFTIEDIARLSHFCCRDVMLTEKWYRNDNGALLVFSADNQKPMVCIPKGRQAYWLIDPETGVRCRVGAEVAKTLLPQAKMFCRPLPNRSLKAKDLVKFCMDDWSKSDAFSFLFLALLGTVIGLLIPYLNEKIYDRFIPMSDSTGLIQLCMVMIACITGKLGFKISENLALFRCGSASKNSLQTAVFDRLFNLPQQVIDQYEAADLSLRAYGMSQVISMIFNTVISGMVAAAFSLLYLFRMFKYAKKLSWIALLMLVLALALVIILGILQMKKEKEVLELESQSNSLIYQLLSGISKIRIAGIENHALYEYLKVYSKGEKITRQKERMTILANTIVLALPTVFSIVFYLMIVKKDLGLSMGVFMGFTSAFSAFSSALFGLAQSFLTVNSAIPTYERAKPILQTPSEFEESAQLPGKLTGEIEVNNLIFGYAGSDQTVINDISFHIKQGEYVGVVGSSGCGKSTLLKLLLGFETPKLGKIYYDGKDIASMDKRELRKKMGVVLQDSQLISGSIYDNITIAMPNAKMSKVEEIVAAVGMRDMIRQLPMGLHTVLSEGDGSVSGGQRQCILIARAIIANPAILFFDEASSALDNITQKTVCDSLNRLGATRIVIAHRLSSVIDCDRILVMDEGHIVEEGSYEKLIALGGRFAQLAVRQML